MSKEEFEGEFKLEFYTDPNLEQFTNTTINAQKVTTRLGIASRKQDNTGGEMTDVLAWEVSQAEAYNIFSAGATDLLFSASLPAAQKTWLIIPLGIAAFIVFYVVFRFAILKFNLKTPGREDDDTDETTVKLANDNFTEVAKIILEGVGGKGNVASIDNCITRLRLEIKDYTAVDEKKIKSAGVAGVIRPGKNSVQVVIGTKVQFVADEFKKLCK